MAVGIYNDGRSWEAYQQAIEQLTIGADHTTYYPLLWLNIPDPSPGAEPFNADLVDLFPNEAELDSNLSNYRRDAYASKLKISDNGLEFVAVYDTRSSNVLESVINIARTLFVTVVLAVASAHFGNQTNRLVLGPIERMLEKVRLIATNPLAAASDQVEMAGALSMAHQIDRNKKAKDKELETQLLEQAITKIGHLLAIGFGDAGTTIISKNMSSTGDMNPMVPG